MITFALCTLWPRWNHFLQICTSQRSSLLSTIQTLIGDISKEIWTFNYSSPSISRVTLSTLFAILSLLILHKVVENLRVQWHILMFLLTGRLLNNIYLVKRHILVLS